MPREAAAWDAVAGSYERWVITPFARGVDFPLRRDAARLLRAWKRDGTLARRVVADFGCGRGQGLGLFAGRVGVAVGLDFSARMLDLSERMLKKAKIPHVRCRGVSRLGVRLATNPPRAVLVQADIADLKPLRKSVDVALAVSSILPPDARDARRLLREVAASLRPGGLLLAVLPSLDAFHYLLALAERLGADLPDVGRVDRRGVFHERGERQKFFTPAEIRTLCRRSRLTIVSLAKVRYPWRHMRRFGWGYFPGHPPLWDWYVVARRPRR